MNRLLFFFLFVASSPAFAQWNNSPSVNTAIVRTATTDNFPFMVRDGAGGAIVLFEKFGVGTDIYAQKINADGTVAWGTDATPVVVCNAANEQYSIHAISDGAGGAFLAWYDFRHQNDSAEIYVQHISSTGASLWTANGIRLTETASSDEFEPYLCTDGTGGIIVAWNWQNEVTKNLQISAQRVNAAGTALWPLNGIQVCTAAGFRAGQGIVADGAGGAIIGFSDSRNDPNGLNYDVFVVTDMVNTDIFAQRLDSDGSRLWGNNGSPVCVASGNQDNYLISSVQPDGVGGALFVFNDGRNDVPDMNNDPTNQDIFAQRLNSFGVPQWPLNGVAFTAAVGNQYLADAAGDAVNGWVAAWNDESQEKIYSQRVNPAGAVQWTNNGLQVSPPNYPAYDPVVTTDGSGNYIYCYTAPINNTLQAQKLNSTGAAQWGFSGTMVCNALNASPGQQRIVLSDDGGVITAWEDQRNNNNYDIYGSKILSTGVLASASIRNYITIAAGDWNNPAIWQGGQVPDASAAATVRHAVTVTANATCYALQVEQPGGNVTVNAGVTLEVTH